MKHAKSLYKKARDNTRFRRILKTTPQLQVVVMSLAPLQEIPYEQHDSATQMVRVEDGIAWVDMKDKRIKLVEGDYCVIPPATQHRIQNALEHRALKLSVVYAPPQHRLRVLK